LISPNTLVPFPVRNCTDYTERTALAPEPKPEQRGFGFVSVDALRVRQGETVEIIRWKVRPIKPSKKAGALPRNCGMAPVLFSVRVGKFRIFQCGEIANCFFRTFPVRYEGRKAPAD